MIPFIVLGTQRTGTTLVATSLNSHPEITCLGEVFKTFRRRAKVDVGDSGYLLYRRAKIQRHVGHYFWRRRVIRAYLDSVFQSSHSPATRAIGLKLMLIRVGQSAEILEYLVERGARGVNVYRDNSLKTLLSRMDAQATGVFHSTQHSERGALKVPTNDLIARLDKLDAQKNEWRTLIGG